MSAINLNWEADGSIDSYNIYRSEASIRSNDLPEPIVTGVTTKNFLDTSVNHGNTYQYRVSSVAGLIERVGDQVSIDTVFDSVELLLDGQSTAYPSSFFQDRSSKKRVVTVLDSALKKSNPKFYYDGVMSFDGASDGLMVSIPSLGVNDFTLEIRGVLYHDQSEPWSRIFQVGSEGPNYLSLFRIGTSSPAQYALHTRRSDDVSQSLIEMNIGINQSEFVDICIMRKSGVFYTFVNGVLAGLNDSNLNHQITPQTIYFMRNNTESNDTRADIDAIRLTLFARYNASGYTPLNLRFPWA